MAGTVALCPSCRKANESAARYCIGCGSIIRPVYCSSCGTVNPEGLDQCIECGNSIPKLSGIRWRPIVTVLQPTSAMSIERESVLEIPLGPEAVSEPQAKEFLLRVREKLTG